MKMKIGLAVSIALFSSPAIAGEFKMDLVPANGQQSRMESGIEAVDSRAEHSSVRLIQDADGIKKRGVVQILVVNEGDSSFNFGAENVSIFLADGTPVGVIPYDRLVKEEKKKAMWRGIAAGLAAAGNNLNAANAGYTTGSVYSGYGSAGFTSYNSGQAIAAQAVANKQNDDLFAKVAATHQANLAALGENMQTTTVDPDGMFGGLLTFELPKSVRKSKVDVPLVFVVRAGDEEHHIQASLLRR